MHKIPRENGRRLIYLFTSAVCLFGIYLPKLKVILPYEHILNYRNNTRTEFRTLVSNLTLWNVILPKPIFQLSSVGLNPVTFFSFDVFHVKPIDPL
jgi:hypothetical protein